jgi:TrmH family RNA methyltransferase
VDRNETSTKGEGQLQGRLRRLEGRHNALLKELRQGFAKQELTPEGYAPIEGLRMVEEAIRSGLRFRAVFFSASAHSRAQRLLPQIGSHVEMLLVPDKLFAGAVPSETPQGVAALVRWKAFRLPDILLRASRFPVLIVAGIQDPGNLGTIIRSAEAFEAAGVVIGEGTVSPFNPKVVRASAGSIFRLPLVRAKLSEAMVQMRAQGLPLLATSSHKGVPLYQVSLAGPVAIFVGNEGAGLPRNMASEMDETIAIPHAAQVESLNAGVAASIVLYEAARQKRNSPQRMD